MPDSVSITKVGNAMSKDYLSVNLSDLEIHLHRGVHHSLCLALLFIPFSSSPYMKKIRLANTTISRLFPSCWSCSGFQFKGWDRRWAWTTLQVLVYTL